MKTFLVIASILAAGLTAYSQSATGNDTMESLVRRGLPDGRDHNLITLQPERPNEIRHGNVTYDGIFVQFIKSDNKLQLINPAAPPEYGSGRDNLVEDPNLAPGTGAREGLKLFSIQF